MKMMEVSKMREITLESFRIGLIWGIAVGLWIAMIFQNFRDEYRVGDFDYAYWIKDDDDEEGED